MKYLVTLYKLLGIFYFNSRPLKLFSVVLIITYTIGLALTSKIYIIDKRLYENHRVARVASLIEWIGTMAHFFAVLLTTFANNHKIYSLFENLSGVLLKLPSGKTLWRKMSIYVSLQIPLGTLLTIWLVVAFWKVKLHTALENAFLVTLNSVTYTQLYLRELVFFNYIMMMAKILEEVKKILVRVHSRRNIKKVELVCSDLCLVNLDGNGIFVLVYTTTVLMTLVEVWSSSFMFMHILFRLGEFHPWWIFSSSVTISFNLLKFIALLHYCEKVQKELELIKMAIHDKLNLGKNPEDVDEQLKMFSIRLLLEDIQFKGHGFVFRMNIMFEVLYVSFTYLIFLFQCLRG